MEIGAHVVLHFAPRVLLPASLLGAVVVLGALGVVAIVWHIFLWVHSYIAGLLILL